MRLRDELWFKGRDWFQERLGAIPQDDALIAELTAPTYTFTSTGKMVVESKADMKKRGMRSPDLADAFFLTFACGERRKERYRRPVRRCSAWAAVEQSESTERLRRAYYVITQFVRGPAVGLTDLCDSTAGCASRRRVARRRGVVGYRLGAAEKEVRDLASQAYGLSDRPPSRLAPRILPSMVPMSGQCHQQP